MSDAAKKPLLLAAGAVGSLLLAISSRHAANRRKAGRRRAREKANDVDTTLDVGLAAAAALATNVAQTSETRGGTPDGAILLLLHGLLSVALLYVARFWQPRAFSTEETWLQLIGSLLIGCLSLHTAYFYYLRSAYYHHRRRHLQNQAISAVATELAQELTPAAVLRQQESITQLNGVWIKDKELSDSMTPVCDLMQLNGVMRFAIGLIRGVQISCCPSKFEFAVLSGVLWFKIKERYELNGEESRHRRRDFRGGGSLGRATPAAEGGVEIAHRFGEPMPGVMEERFYCPEENVMFVDTVIALEVKNGGGVPELQNLTYRQVYRK